jgi:hypothetical protein
MRFQRLLVRIQVPPLPLAKQLRVSFPAFQRFTSSKLALKTVESRFFRPSIILKAGVVVLLGEVYQVQSVQLLYHLDVQKLTKVKRVRKYAKFFISDLPIVLFYR